MISTQIIKQLYLIATKITNDVPDQEPNKITVDGIKIWDLGNGRKFSLSPIGDKGWYLNGKLHREDGPAVIWIDGSKTWYLNGRLHREHGPAIERPDGRKEWWINDKRHREDGPAIEYADGTKDWFLNDKRIKSKNYDSPQFKKRWQKLLELEGIRQVMED